MTPPGRRRGSTACCSSTPSAGKAGCPPRPARLSQRPVGRLSGQPGIRRLLRQPAGFPVSRRDGHPGAETRPRHCEHHRPGSVPLGRRIGVLPAPGAVACVGAGGPDPGHPAPVESGAFERRQRRQHNRRAYWSAQGRPHRGAGVIGFLQQQQLLDAMPGKPLPIWDGAPSTAAGRFVSFCRRGRAARRLQPERLPGYAPELNPDEGGWGYWKRV